jgi:membrane fusion protein (multidrug efflux system)
MLVAVALAACSDGDAGKAAAAGAPTKGGPAGGPGGGAGGPPAAGVEVMRARRDTVLDVIAATGQVEAMQAIELRPEVEGRVTAIYVREGAIVNRGAALFKIDDAELRAQVERAEAERDLARQSLTRTRDLIAQKASSQSELERVEASARSAEAELSLLRVRLQRTTVRAPFTGVAGSRTVSLGDYVNNQSRLLTLQTVDPQRAAFDVPERHAARLARGQKVTFRVAALPGKEFTGTVDFVDPVVRLPGRTIMVKAMVPNPSRELQAGMFLEARLSTETRTDAIVIPEDAVVPMLGNDFVWVVVDGKAARRQVDLGVRTPGFVEVRSGVAADEMVVVGGAERLQEGATVNATVIDRTPPVAGDTVAPK